VRVRYPTSDEPKVALCLKTATGEDQQLVKRVGSEFGRMFSSHESLDVMFLRPDEEDKIAAVAKPFYRSQVVDAR
jgi:hypothetical protein